MADLKQLLSVRVLTTANRMAELLSAMGMSSRAVHSRGMLKQLRQDI